MKRIHILEKKRHILESQVLNEASEFQAGTDHPYFEDERTGQSYEATWDCDYGFPFGYWPEEYGGRCIFSLGESYTTHVNACGKVAKRYFYNIEKERLEEVLSEFIDAVEDLVRDFEEYGYTYNEEDELWVSSDGSDEIDLDDWVDGYSIYPLSHEQAMSIVESAIGGGSIPSVNELSDMVAADEAESYDFTSRREIDQALGDIGSSFENYFESGRNEGRIWTNAKMIGFYSEQQPSPSVLINIMQDLASTGIVTYEELLNYTMVFEDGRNDWAVTACTLSDYIDGNYGPDSYEDEEDEDEIQYARDGKTQFVPHLASQGEKREFFKDFRDTRDRAVYAPRERAAGNLARYHALRYPYGEGKDRFGIVIR